MNLALIGSDCTAINLLKRELITLASKASYAANRKSNWKATFSLFPKIQEQIISPF
jgi:hypothetical protein